MRFLYRVGDDELFARATNRRDFVRVSDDVVWAHESHEWLIAAGTGAVLAHRTGDVYYSADTGRPLYYETSEPLPANADGNDGSSRSGRHRIPAAESMRRRHERHR